MHEQRAQQTSRRRAGKLLPGTAASPHSIGTHAGMRPVDAPFTTSDEDEEYDDVWPPRLKSSTRRYQEERDAAAQVRQVQALSPVPKRASAPQEGELRLIQGVSCVWSRGAWHRFQVHPHTPVASPLRAPQYAQTEEHVPLQESEQPRRQKTRRVPWMLPVGLGMLVMFLVWLAATAASQWWQTTRDDWTYGRPRTYSIDAVVGHHDSVENPSHFIVQNWQKRIMIIELPGGDLSKAIIIQGPTLLGDEADLTPVTLTFQDVTGDGKPDMLLHVGDQTFYLINDGHTFRAPHPGEVHS